MVRRGVPELGNIPGKLASHCESARLIYLKLSSVRKELCRVVFAIPVTFSLNSGGESEQESYKNTYLVRKATISSKCAVLIFYS